MPTKEEETEQTLSEAISVFKKYRGSGENMFSSSHTVAADLGKIATKLVAAGLGKIATELEPGIFALQVLQAEHFHYYTVNAIEEEEVTAAVEDTIKDHKIKGNTACFFLHRIERSKSVVVIFSYGGKEESLDLMACMAGMSPSYEEKLMKELRGIDWHELTEKVREDTGVLSVFLKESIKSSVKNLMDLPTNQPKTLQQTATPTIQNTVTGHPSNSQEGVKKVLLTILESIGTATTIAMSAGLTGSLVGVTPAAWGKAGFLIGLCQPIPGWGQVALLAVCVAFSLVGLCYLVPKAFKCGQRFLTSMRNNYQADIAHEPTAPLQQI